MTSEIPTKTPNKNLPNKINSVYKICLITLAPIHKKFAISTLYHGPIFETITPPINDPMAMPRAPIIVTIVIIFI